MSLLQLSCSALLLCSPARLQVTVSDEVRTSQYLAWYLREMALLAFHSLDRPFCRICLDCELPALFKELWCKKAAPTDELVATYSRQPPLPRDPPAPPPPPPALEVSELTRLADAFGRLLQNRHQGFMPNLRQQRAAGLGAMELGQALLELIGARRSGLPALMVPSLGSSGPAASSPGAQQQHRFGWRDAMDLVVKWRQLSEPGDQVGEGRGGGGGEEMECAPHGIILSSPSSPPTLLPSSLQVVWVDMLTPREFEQGFGSHTPMFTGQSKTVRYYMNFDRAFASLKKVGSLVRRR
jgi:hypothetical protein